MMMKVKVTMMMIMSVMMMMMMMMIVFFGIHTPKRLTKATTNATKRR